jgi:hypothetical protein
VQLRRVTRQGRQGSRVRVENRQCVCVCVCVRACVRACMRACARARVRVVKGGGDCTSNIGGELFSPRKQQQESSTAL